MDQELVQYLDGRFNGLASELDRRFDEVNGRIEEVKRHGGVLAEALHREVRLMAENLATHVEAEHVRHQAVQEQFRETRALLHLSYEQLHQRVENLERRERG